jgi:hypothetical protein
MVCHNASPLDFGNSCIRTSWSALLPATFVFILCTTFLIPKSFLKFLRPVKLTFTNYLTLHEAEAFDASSEKPSGDEGTQAGVQVENLVPLWRTVVLSFIAMLETLSWLTFACFTFIARPEHTWGGITSALIALTWLYASCRPIVHPTPTPPYDLFVLYIMHFIMGILRLGGVLHAKDVYGLPLPPPPVMVGLVFNLVAVLTLLCIVMSMPLGIPSNRVKRSDIVSSLGRGFFKMLSSQRYL